MFSSSKLRGTAIVAAAFALAACGSDKAAGPTTANNDQIVSEMMSTLQGMGDSASTEEGLALQAAIIGLSAGAPVNPGNVTIDGRSYSFSTTSVTIEQRDSESGETYNRLTYVVGWRHTNGDSVFVAMYAPDGDMAFDLGASSDVRGLPGSGTRSMAQLSTMLRSGNFTVSKSVSSGPDDAVAIMLSLDGTVWAAAYDEGIVSGSASYSTAAGECDVDGLDNLGMGDVNASSCELQKSNISLEANTTEGYSGEEEPAAGPGVTVPAQSVTGAKFFMNPA